VVLVGVGYHGHRTKETSEAIHAQGGGPSVIAVSAAGASHGKNPGGTARAGRGATGGMNPGGTFGASRQGAMMEVPEVVSQVPIVETVEPDSQRKSRSVGMGEAARGKLSS
jgi:hypothetical protein